MKAAGLDPVAGLPAEAGVAAEFAADLHAPGRARRLVVAVLLQWGHESPLVDNAALVVSELATNAVLHAGSPFLVTVRADDSIVRVAVGDRSPLLATERHGGLIPRPMHGLGLVDRLSTHWGARQTHDGKVVWAELRP